MTEQEENDKLQRDYLGSGIYVAFRNGQIEISVNDHRSEPVAYLDCYTSKNMKRYINRVFNIME